MDLDQQEIVVVDVGLSQTKFIQSSLNSEGPGRKGQYLFCVVASAEFEL